MKTCCWLTLLCCVSCGPAEEEFLAPEATGGFHQCSVPEEVEWALDASHHRDVCDGFTGAGAVQRATYFTSPLISSQSAAQCKEHDCSVLRNVIFFCSANRVSPALKYLFKMPVVCCDVESCAHSWIVSVDSFIIEFQLW